MKTRARFPIYWAAAWALLMGCSSPETAPPRLDPGFRFSQLASHRMAVWPVKTLETDLDTRHVMLSEYGSREAFLKAFSQKLSGRLLAVSGGSSLDSQTLARELAAGSRSSLLEPEALLKTLDTRASTRESLPGSATGPIGIPALQGIRYAFLCRHFSIERKDDAVRDVLSTSETVRYMGLDITGEYAMTEEYARAQEKSFMRGPVRLQTRAVLRMALLDLESGTLVWEESFRATSKVDRRKGLYEVQELLAIQILDRIQRR
jgi:hypothetical protein